MLLSEGTKALLEKTAQLNAAGKYTDTIELLTTSLLNEYKSPELYMQLGQAKFNSNQRDEALEAFEKAIRLNPGYAMAYYNRGTVFYYNNQFELALADYNKAIELDPELVLAYLNRANIWYNSGELEKAFDDYSKAIEADPNAALAYYGRGNVLYNKSEFAKAIKDYDKAIFLSPDFVLAYNNRGLCYVNLRNSPNALKDFDEAIRLQPGLAILYNNKGLLRLNNEQYDEAIALFNKAIDLDSSQLLSWFNRGMALLQKGEPQKAVDDFTSVIDKMKTYAPAFYRRGMAYEQLEKNKKYEHSIEDYKEAISLDPGFDFLKAKIEELQQINAGKPEPVIENKDEKNIFQEILAKIVATVEKEEISELAQKFDKCIKQIKNHARIKNPCPVVHYTKLWVADIIALDPNPSYLHYSNVAFMNDPEEGKVLKDVLLGKDPDKKLQEYFRDADLFTSKDANDANVYLGSFLPAAQVKDAETKEESQAETHEDELVMWRTYGKDENMNEAAGCSIVIHNDFFSWPPLGVTPILLQSLAGEITNSQQPASGQFSLEQINAQSKLLHEKSQDNNEKNLFNSVAPENTLSENTDPHILYRVLYYNKLKGKIEIRADMQSDGADENAKLRSDVDELKTVFKDLVNRKSGMTEKAVIDEMIVKGVSELRYFFKSANYSFENEYRVIKYHDSGDKAVLIEERKTLPKPLYIKSAKPIKPYIMKIYMGPKVEHPERWNYLEVALKRNGGVKEVKVVPSSCKFQ